MIIGDCPPFKYILASVICLVLLGCSFQETTPLMKVNQLTVNENSLDINFEIYNKLPIPVWVCEDVSIYLPANEITEINGTEGFVRRQVSAYPDTVVFDEPMIGKYVRLDAGSAKEYSVNIMLFERFMTFYTGATSLSFSKPLRSFSNVSTVSFSVGYLDMNLCKAYLNLAERSADNRTGLDYELPLFVEEYHPDRCNPEILYIPHFWERIEEEKTLEINCIMRNQRY